MRLIGRPLTALTGNVDERLSRGAAFGQHRLWGDGRAGVRDDVLTQFQVVKHDPSGSVIEVRTITSRSQAR
jgi:hypothetical protein